MTVPRVILHVDANCFYASCEMRDRPELRLVPMVVGGDETMRHGIVLAKNELARKTGIVTAEVLWKARQKCPGLVCVPPRMREYERMSVRLRRLFYEYTDCVEPFGLDEAWLDITRCPRKDGPAVADEIRRRVREELGITVSVGVAFSKIFAKLGSDLKKPDATTIITPENVERLVWPLGVRALLYVGQATERKLARIGVHTIGQLARMPREALRAALGKHGEMLHGFANGRDNEMVMAFGHSEMVRSVGNSATTPRDLVCDVDAKLTLHMLAESVGARLREQGLQGRTVRIWVRDNALEAFERQTKLPRATQLTGEIAGAAFALFRAHYCWQERRPVRSLGVAVADIMPIGGAEQLSLLEEDRRHERLACVERALDDIRNRYGYWAIQRGMMLGDPSLTHLDAKDEHIVAQVGYQG
jgi:DNA polymerase-4